MELRGHQIALGRARGGPSSQSRLGFSSIFCKYDAKRLLHEV